MEPSSGDLPPAERQANHRFLGVWWRRGSIAPSSSCVSNAAASDNSRSFPVSKRQVLLCDHGCLPASEPQGEAPAFVGLDGSHLPPLLCSAYRCACREGLSDTLKVANGDHCREVAGKLRELARNDTIARDPPGARGSRTALRPPRRSFRPPVAPANFLSYGLLPALFTAAGECGTGRRTSAAGLSSRNP